VQKSVTQVAIEMHSSYRKWEASIESEDITGSPWMHLPSRRNHALRKLPLRLCLM
jgi:hypothetical protein